MAEFNDYEVRKQLDRYNLSHDPSLRSAFADCGLDINEQIEHLKNNLPQPKRPQSVRPVPHGQFV